MASDAPGHPPKWTSPSCSKVLDNSLEARVLQSDNSALAKDCRKEMRALNTRLLKLGAQPHGDWVSHCIAP